MFPHTNNKWSNIVKRGRMSQLPVVKPQANPEVIHQNGEEQHHNCNAPWTTKFVARRMDKIKMSVPKRHVSWERTIDVGPWLYRAPCPLLMFQ
jgi:hypothetical protein